MVILDIDNSDVHISSLIVTKRCNLLNSIYNNPLSHLYDFQKIRDNSIGVFSMMNPSYEILDPSYHSMITSDYRLYKSEYFYTIIFDDNSDGATLRLAYPGHTTIRII